MDYLPDPDLILKQQGRGIEILRKLEIDAHLTAVKQQRIMQVTSMNWRVRNGIFELFKSEVDGVAVPDKKSSPADKEIEDLLRSLEIESIIESSLDCLFYGYVVFEIMWELKSGKLKPKAIIEKPQEWFVFGEENELRLLKDATGWESEPVPPNKFLIARNKPKYNNPYGEKLLSRCFWPVTLKKDGIVFWSYMAEKYGMPYLIGKVNKNASPEQKDKFLSALQTMRRDAVAVIDDDESIEPLDINSRGDSKDLYQAFINFQNTEISKAVLTVTLTTEVQDKGAYAASQTHKEILDRIALADKKIVERMINNLLNLLHTKNE